MNAIIRSVFFLFFLRPARNSFDHLFYSFSYTENCAKKIEVLRYTVFLIIYLCFNCTDKPH